MTTANSPESERDETDAERDDRLWDDMLQELRVVQTGAQLIAGFLLTLPFQQAFATLTTVERRWYLTLVVLAGLVVALGLLIVGSTSFVFHVVAGGAAATILGVAMGVAVAFLLLVLPRLLVMRDY